MYKIEHYSSNINDSGLRVSYTDANHECYYKFLFIRGKLEFMFASGVSSNIWREHALGAEEFANDWLKYNKEFI